MLENVEKRQVSNIIELDNIEIQEEAGKMANQNPWEYQPIKESIICIFKIINDPVSGLILAQTW